MNPHYHNLQWHYNGFLNTHLLWENDSNHALLQLELPNSNTAVFDESISKKMRLGKIVERFASHYFSSFKSINILQENIPIQRDKLTLGELDCLLKIKDQYLHVEIAYKFYLYDGNHGSSEEEHWIGPNRRDNLQKKLSKLNLKQLPLLFSPECVKALETYGLNTVSFEQRVYFKAQLFVPFKHLRMVFPKVNNACIQGFYLRLNELEQFNSSKFYLPEKIDWLLDVKTQTDWQTYTEMLPKIQDLLQSKKSPMCWIKNTNGQTQKCFIVWW